MLSNNAQHRTPPLRGGSLALLGAGERERYTTLAVWWLKGGVVEPAQRNTAHRPSAQVELEFWKASMHYSAEPSVVEALAILKS